MLFVLCELPRGENADASCARTRSQVKPVNKIRCEITLEERELPEACSVRHCISRPDHRIGRRLPSSLSLSPSSPSPAPSFPWLSAIKGDTNGKSDQVALTSLTFWAQRTARPSQRRRKHASCCNVTDDMVDCLESRRRHTGLIPFTLCNYTTKPDCAIDLFPWRPKWHLKGQLINWFCPRSN